jgi:hypothetical protein
MAGLLFVSQTMLDSWAGQGKIDFVGNVMTLLAGEGKGRSYGLDPAVRFLKVLGAEADPHALLHKVKSEAQLRELGAEHVEASVILGDVAYEVEPGFLAEVSALQAAAAAQRRPEARAEGAAVAPAGAGRAGPHAGRSQGPGAAPLPRELEEKRKAAEALARFLLDHLS